MRGKTFGEPAEATASKGLHSSRSSSSDDGTLVNSFAADGHRIFACTITPLEQFSFLDRPLGQFQKVEVSTAFVQLPPKAGDFRKFDTGFWKYCSNVRLNSQFLKAQSTS
jgi:hypothetical protein